MYQVMYLAQGGEELRSRSFNLAPHPMLLFRWRHPKAIFAIRYYPSKKAWRVYDMRLFKRDTLRSGKPIIKAPKYSYESVSQEACVMYAALS